MDGPFHIVITHTALVLLRWPGADWRMLQDHYEGFVTSMGPMDEDEALDLIHAEWPDLARLSSQALHRFFAEEEAVLLLSGRL
jgi:hypothetical protein